MKAKSRMLKDDMVTSRRNNGRPDKKIECAQKIWAAYEECGMDSEGQQLGVNVPITPELGDKLRAQGLLEWEMKAYRFLTADGRCLHMQAVTDTIKGTKKDVLPGSTHFFP